MLQVSIINAGHSQEDFSFSFGDEGNLLAGGCKSQDALQKSNDVFETFKLEIEKMAKSIKELRKENAFLKGKCDKSDYTLIELVEERERLKKQLKKTKSQKEKLESLCRSLQAERKQSLEDKKTSEDVFTQASQVKRKQSLDDQKTSADVITQASDHREQVSASQLG